MAFSYNDKYINKYWVNILGIFITASTKTDNNNIAHLSISDDTKGPM